MADDNELLHVDEHVFDTDDLTYEEHREIKRIARLEIWDEDIDGPFEDLSTNDLIPAIITVFMRRVEPGFTLEQARAYKPTEVFPEVPPTRASPNGVTPTVVPGSKPAAAKSSARSSRAKASAATGPQS